MKFGWQAPEGDTDEDDFFDAWKDEEVTYQGQTWQGRRNPWMERDLDDLERY